MISKLNEDLIPFEDLAASFAAKELADNREETDRYPFSPFPQETIDKAKEVGLFSATLPEKFGGIGQGISALCLILDQISRVDASLAAVIFTNTFAQELLLATDNTSFLDPEAIFAYPVFNDPSEIADLAEVRHTPDGYLLSGSLDYVVLAPLASFAIVPAGIPGDYGLFIVDLKDERVKINEPVLSLGLRTCPASDLEFNDAPAQLISQKGRLTFEEVCDRMHVAAAAILTGIMKGSLEEALTYAQERFQGGREIIGWSEMQIILGQMGIMANNADMILDRASLAVETKEPGWQQSSRAAASLVGEMACDLTTDGIQVLGGYGYMHDYGQEKRFRDAKHTQTLMGITARKKIRFLKKMIG